MCQRKTMKARTGRLLLNDRSGERDKFDVYGIRINDGIDKEYNIIICNSNEHIEFRVGEGGNTKNNCTL